MPKRSSSCSYSQRLRSLLRLLNRLYQPYRCRWKTHSSNCTLGIGMTPCLLARLRTHYFPLPIRRIYQNDQASDEVYSHGVSRKLNEASKKIHGHGIEITDDDSLHYFLLVTRAFTLHRVFKSCMGFVGWLNSTMGLFDVCWGWCKEMGSHLSWWSESSNCKWVIKWGVRRLFGYGCFCKGRPSPVEASR